MPQTETKDVRQLLEAAGHLVEYLIDAKHAAKEPLFKILGTIMDKLDVLERTIDDPLYNAFYNSPLLQKVDDFYLSVRSANSLKGADIIYVGDLIQKSEADMLRTPNFGRKSLNEVNEMLAKMDLH